MSKDVVNSLYRFLKEDVKLDKLQESTKDAFSNVEKQNSDILKENTELLKNRTFTSRFYGIQESELEITDESILKEWAELSKDAAFLAEHTTRTNFSGVHSIFEKLQMCKDNVKITEQLKTLTDGQLLALHYLAN